MEENNSLNQTICPLPKRRHVLEAAGNVGADTAKKDSVDPINHSGGLSTGRKIAWVGGASIAAVAVAIPAVSFAAAKTSASETGQLRAIETDSKWDSSDLGSEVISVASGLNNYEGAASRAKLRTPIAVSQCVAGDAPANGSRSITQQDVIYWPLRPGTYTQTSEFGWRVSPVSGEMLLHEGVDMAASLDEPIYAVAAGKVIDVSENSHSGAFVTIEHSTATGERYTTSYLHQYMDQILVHKGDEVKAGQQIGHVGSNGWSTGAHLHFEVRNAKDEPIEPIGFMKQQGAIFIGEDCQ